MEHVISHKWGNHFAMRGEVAGEWSLLVGEQELYSLAKCTALGSSLEVKMCFEHSFVIKLCS